MKKLRIGFIGNFRVSYTTENDRKWSFEKLGHEVIPFQENETSALDLTSALHRLDMLMYSHTHGWEIAGLKHVFDVYRERNIPTVSVHLDRWAWLARERDVGKEATWFTEYHFMADFSPEAKLLYERNNLKKVFYLEPGVIERDCYMAEPDHAKFPHEIVFVGSKGYHPEYAFRPKLIDFLAATYGPQFGHYGNDGLGVVREGNLNTLYATAKIAVGDSCFGGRPNYVSDRYYETRGRGGFLLHPHIEGVDMVGVAPYESENLLDLKNQIDYYLNDNIGREDMRRAGFEWVKENETYTNRAEKMLNIIFGGEQ